jgi:hypothetical protein
MKKYFIQTNLPFIFILSYLITCIYRIPNINEAIIIVALSGLFGFKLWLDHNKKPDINKEYEKRFLKLEGYINSTQAEKIAQAQQQKPRSYSWTK